MATNSRQPTSIKWSNQMVKSRHHATTAHPTPHPTYTYCATTAHPTPHPTPHTHTVYTQAIYTSYLLPTRFCLDFIKLYYKPPFAARPQFRAANLAQLPQSFAVERLVSCPQSVGSSLERPNASSSFEISWVHQKSVFKSLFLPSCASLSCVGECNYSRA